MGRSWNRDGTSWLCTGRSGLQSPEVGSAMLHPACARTEACWDQSLPGDTSGHCPGHRASLLPKRGKCFPKSSSFSPLCKFHGPLKDIGERDKNKASQPHQVVCATARITQFPGSFGSALHNTPSPTLPAGIATAACPPTECRMPSPSAGLGIQQALNKCVLDAR